MISAYDGTIIRVRLVTVVVVVVVRRELVVTPPAQRARIVELITRMPLHKPEIQRREKVQKACTPQASRKKKSKKCVGPTRHWDHYSSHPGFPGHTPASPKRTNKGPINFARKARAGAAVAPVRASISRGLSFINSSWLSVACGFHDARAPARQASHIPGKGHALSKAALREDRQGRKGQEARCDAALPEREWHEDVEREKEM